jgi:signal transduction histidine kinase
MNCGVETAGRKIHPWAEDAPGPAPYGRVVVPNRPVLWRWVRPLAMLAVALILSFGGRSQTRPGLHGVGLALSVSMLAVLAGTVLLLRARIGRPQRLPVYLAVIAGSTVMVWLEPAGSGFLGGFVAVSTAAAQLPKRAGLAVAACGMAALTVAQIAGDHRAAGPGIVDEIGLIAFYCWGLYARRLRERSEQAEELLRELEQTRAAETRAAALAERQYLAREMHDVLAHSLSGLLLQLEGARLMAACDAHNPQLPDTIERAHHLAKSGLAEARRAIGTLREEELPGPERLSTLATEFTRDTGVRCEVVQRGTPWGLDPEQRLTVYRVAQEALTNIAKHAKAERSLVRIGYTPDHIQLDIEDFGVPTGKMNSGYGLTGMRERAELLDGRLSAGPTESGFRVSLWLPA